MFLIGNGLVGVDVRRCAVLCLGLLTCISVQAASAADCPGHPDALGTSRTLVVDPREHPRIGTMQYPETLPLEDHEVVLTFDDGPLPRNSNQILAILASQCIKATFFEIGQMARAYPEGVRKLRDAGHSIGTHSQNHPLTMNKMPIERARQEIDDGIASVKAALGDDTRSRLFSGSPACCAPRTSRTIWHRRASRPGAPIFPPTTGGIFRPRVSTTSRSSGWRIKAKAFCCSTTSRREPSQPCREFCPS